MRVAAGPAWFRRHPFRAEAGGLFPGALHAAACGTGLLNSLRSDELASGVGLIKQELRELGSALMAVADATRVPAGKALAVDRELFAGKVTELVEAEPNITLVRKAIADLDDPALEGFERVVISAGPLASESLSASIARAVGAEHLYFYDAIAPIVAADSIDMGIAFWGSRYGRAGRGRLSELSHERRRVQGVLSGPARRREGRQPRI